MPCDYQRIRKDNIKEYGEGTRHLNLFRTLYSQRTHFIYELIQNAEDAEAKKMCFRLFADRLEIEHDGRLFNEKDVRGVCGVGEGTKDKDLTKIGKFGIGFKSVYAYTDDPEVHCGGEHFRIKSYVRPHSCDARDASEGFSTLFVLRFSNTDVRPEDPFKEVGNALQHLSANTILFLKSIQALTIESNAGQSRRLQRDRQGNNPAEVLLKCTDEEDEKWLVFDRPVQLDGHSVRVEVGFQIEMDKKQNLEKRIVRVSKSPLVVFFPTEKETNLGFVIQGPYRTTPARDNIPKDDKANRHLIEETAKLVVESFEWLRDNGMLTVEVLQTLPIKPYRFEEGSMFRPIFDAVRDALLERPLLPGYSESDKPARFVSARQAKLAGSSELRRLLSSEQLSELFGTHKPAFWLSPDITPAKTRDLWDYLKTVIKIDELDPDGFVRRINENFMKGQTDEWVVSFYRFLLEQQAWIRSVQDNRASSWSVPFRDKPIIRLEDGRHIAPFSDDKATPAAHLPGSVQSDRPTVKTIFAETEVSREFLAAIGYTVPDIVDEVLELILPRYASATTNVPDYYRSDLELILDALKTDSESKKRRLRERLQECYWILAENAQSGEKALKRPSEIYFKEKGMAAYFAGNPGAWFLDQSLGQFKNRFEDVGVSRSVRISKKGSNYLNHVSITDQHGWHKRGLNGFDPEITIDGFEFAISNPTSDKSAFIWNEIAIPYRGYISGLVESSHRSTYKDSSRKERCSKHFGCLLMEREWLLGKGGQFHRPAELYLDDLPQDFTPDRTLAETLGMKSDALATLARETGVDPAVLEYAIKNQERIKNEMQAERKKVSAPVPHSDSPTSVQPAAAPTGTEKPTGPTEAATPSSAKPDSGSPEHPTTAPKEREPLGLKDPETAEYVVMTEMPSGGDGSGGRGGGRAGGGGGGEGGDGDGGGDGGIVRVPLSKEQRDEIEMAGRVIAGRALREKLGYEVEPMPLENPGFDLMATKDGEELRVEVKAHLGRATVVDDLTITQYKECQNSKTLGAGYKWELWNIENLKDDAGKVVITRYDDIPEEALKVKMFRVDLKKCIPAG